MRRRQLAYGLFGLGVFLLAVHTTMPALWQVLALPGAYPLASNTGLLAMASGFTPPIGAGMMLAGGFVYGSGGTRGR